MEKPDAADGFHNGVCIVPGYPWQDVFGFSDRELARCDAVIRSDAKRMFQR